MPRLPFGTLISTCSVSTRDAISLLNPENESGSQARGETVPAHYLPADTAVLVEIFSLSLPGVGELERSCGILPAKPQGWSVSGDKTENLPCKMGCSDIALPAFCGDSKKASN